MRTGLGTKTEIKNVNSFSGIEKAIELEVARQVALLESGDGVRAQTLLWDDHRGALRPMRSKEESHDYRYFPDPDLPSLVLSDADLESARRAVPELPRARSARFRRDYGLSDYDAGVLTQTRAAADYFEAVVERVGDARTSGEGRRAESAGVAETELVEAGARQVEAAKVAANWVMGPAQALMNARGETPGTFAVRPAALAELIGLVAAGTISDTVGKRVLEAAAEGGRGPAEIVSAEGLEQVRDDAALAAWIDEVCREHPDAVERCRQGETRLVGFLVGQVMRRSAGAADPRRVNELIRERLGA